MRRGARDIIIPASAAGTAATAGDGYNIIAAGTQTAATTGTVVFSNSNGITFGMSNSSIVTASHNGLTSQSNQAVSAGNGSFTFQTLTFADSNGVSFSTGTQGIFATVRTNYLTTARASNDAVGLNTAKSNVTWTVNSSGISLDARGYAGTGTSATNASVTLDSNGLAISVGNYLTSQSNQALSGSNGSFTFQTATFGNLNGMSFYTSNGSLVGSYTVPSVTNSSWTVSDAATSGTVARLAFTNLNGVTLSLSTGANGSHTIVGSHNALTSQTNQTIGLFVTDNTTLTTSTTRDARSISFAGEGNVSVGYSNGSVVISGGTAAPSPVNFSAGTTSNNLGAVVFSDSNRVSFGLNGSTITAKHALNFSAGTTSNNVSDQIVFSNSNNVSFGLNGSTITATATVATSLTNIKVSAGTTSNNLSAITFSNSNGVSFGLNGSTLTASIPAVTVSTFMNQQPADVSTGLGLGASTAWFMPMRFINAVSASTGMIPIALTGTVSSNLTHTVNATLRCNLYKVTGTDVSQFDTILTTSFGFTFWNSGTASVSYSYNVTSGSSNGSNLMTASVYGLRMLTFNIGSLLDTGLYAVGYHLSTGSAGGSTILRSFNNMMNIPLGLVGVGFIGSATNQSTGWADAGSYTTTTNNLPASFNITQIVPVFNAVPLFKMGAY